MKILENCTLLQACEYLAFGWKPLSDDDELMLPRERYRPYIESQEIKPGHPMAFNNLMHRLERAKKQLLKLFDNGVCCCRSNYRIVSFPEPKDDYTINILIGIEHENSETGIEIINKQTGDKEFITDATINFTNLQSRLRKFTQKEPDPCFRYELNNIVGELYFFPDTISMIRLRKMNSNLKIDTLLEILTEFPYRTFTREEMAREWPKNAKIKFNPKKDRFDNLLKTSSLPPDIIQAFFPVLTSDKIKFTRFITDMDLKRIGMEEIRIFEKNIDK